MTSMGEYWLEYRTTIDHIALLKLYDPSVIDESSKFFLLPIVFLTTCYFYPLMIAMHHFVLRLLT